MNIVKIRKHIATDKRYHKFCAELLAEIFKIHTDHDDWLSGQDFLQRCDLAMLIKGNADRPYLVTTENDSILSKSSLSYLNIEPNYSITLKGEKKYVYEFGILNETQAKRIYELGVGLLDFDHGNEYVKQVLHEKFPNLKILHVLMTVLKPDEQLTDDQLKRRTCVSLDVVCTHLAQQRLLDAEAHAAIKYAMNQINQLEISWTTADTDEKAQLESLKKRFIEQAGRAVIPIKPILKASLFLIPMASYYFTRSINNLSMLVSMLADGAGIYILSSKPDYLSCQEISSQMLAKPPYPGYFTYDQYNQRRIQEKWDDCHEQWENTLSRCQSMLGYRN